MPVFNEKDKQVPEWCELESFEIITMKPGETKTFNRVGKKEKLIVCEGSCVVRHRDDEINAVLARRDLIVKAIEDLIAEEGEAEVLY